jgi:dTDP-4-dehydrorhamnose reductase
MHFGVIGAQGMFGSEMVILLRAQGQKVVGFNRESIDLEGSVDVLANQLDSLDVIINAVGYTAVDKAETEPDLANKINGEYAGKLSSVSKLIESKFLHISTDYVFDGTSNSPYQTDSKTNPQGAYGRSKLLGEHLVADSGATYTIFRTAWLYGAHGRCFPKVIHEKAIRREKLRVVDDQFGQPTWTKDLAAQVFAFSKLSTQPRIVHAVASGKASWFEFAKEVVGDYEVEPVSTDDFVTAAKRPAFSVLDNSSELVEPIGDWRERWQLAKTEVLGKL